MKWRHFFLMIRRNNLSESQYVCCIASQVNWKPNHVLQTCKKLRHTALLEWMWTPDMVSGTFIRKGIYCYMSHRYWNCLQYGKIRTQQYKQHKPWIRNRLLKKYITVHQKYVLCVETEHSPYCTSEMCTVHRNMNTFWTVNQKWLLCSETTISILYIRNV